MYRLSKDGMCVEKKDGDKWVEEKCHDSKAKAEAHLAALNKNVMDKESLVLAAGQVQEAGDSLDDFIGRVRRAFYQAFNRDLPYERQGWVADVFPDHVVVSKGDKFYRVELTVTADVVTFADLPWPEVRLDYVAVAGNIPADPSAAAGVQESVSLTVKLAEVSKTTEGLYPGSVIVVEGLSANHNEYTAAALASGIQIFEGAKLVADHELEEGAAARPEGSIHDVIGKVTTVRLGEHNGKQALLGDVFVSESETKIRTKIKEGILGDLSIKAFGSGSRAPDGHFVVESFQPHPYTNIAMVTVGAAGGAIQPVSEAVQPETVSDDTATGEDRPDRQQQPVQEGETPRETRLLQESEDMTALEEVTRERDHLLDENTRLFREVRTATGQRLLDAALKQAGALPAATQSRIQTATAALLEQFATHGSQQTNQAFETAANAVIEAERAYLAQLVPNGAVTGLTLPGDHGQTEADAQLEEAFGDLLDTPGQVKIALRGRT